MQSRIATGTAAVGIVAALVATAAVSGSAVSVASVDATARATNPGTTANVGSPTLQPNAAWPVMRHDVHNTGVSELVSKYNEAKPWSFQTGRGIFSTPAVAADGLIYVGSAAQTLYGLDPKSGRPSFSFKTNGIIDTTPALLAPGGAFGPTLTIGSGDAHIYKLREGPNQPANQQPIWEFQPTVPPAGGQVPWWEGSPNVGPDGTIYQGNTGGAAYAINPDGTQKWVYETGYPVWTPPAIGPDGTTYWGSVSTKFFALDPDGKPKWERSTLGYVTSAPALDSQGRLFAGSFDSKVYSLDSATGAVRWTFQTGDHIYSSPALVGDGMSGEAIIIGSVDGSVYKLGADGELLWSYDTGAPVRSSPAVGSDGQGGQIAYVASANGVLSALDVATGAVRWAFDTTSTDPVGANRNELNSSPSLGPEGVYVGSQDGNVWYLPYDYCLANRTQPRCVAGAAAQLPRDGTFMYPSSPGGNLVTDGKPGVISPAGVMIGRLVQRSAGRTVPVRLLSVPDPAALVAITPPVDAAVSLSGDGKYVFIRPREMLPASTEYTVKVAGIGSVGGPEIANLELGPGQLQPISASFRVRTTDDGKAWNPVATADAVSGISVSRLTVPYPALMTSVNQIGFDFYDWIGGAVPMEHGNPIIWLVGAKPGPGGQAVADPVEHPFALPFYGQQRGGTFSWTAGPQTISFEFAAIPFQRFDFRGTFNNSGVIEPDAQIFGQAECASVPTYGAEIPLTGICDSAGLATFAGSYVGQQTTNSPALHRAPGVSVGQVSLTAPTDSAPGTVSVPITVAAGTSYPARQHFVSIMLADRATGLPVIIDYHDLTELTSDAAGNVSSATVTIPANTQLPEQLEAIVMTDAFPAHRQQLTAGAGR